jgi:tetratricopeptide (TPR) repeat protein
LSISDIKSKAILASGVIILIALFCLFGTLNNGWVNWDDPAYVLGNSLIFELSSESISTIFQTPEVVGLYHPLTLISLAIDYHFWETDPYGFHLTNLIIHLVNTLLVFVLFRRVKASILVAGLVALLFGMHPMHVESVAWISARKDVLYTFFFLISILTYLRSTASPGLRQILWLTASLAACCLSLLSKNIAFTLPFVLFLFDYLEGRKISLRSSLNKVPFIVLAVIAMVVAQSGQVESDSMRSISSVDFSQTIFYGMYNSIFYIFKAIVPINLAAFHPFPMEGDSLSLQYLAVIPFLGLLFALYISYKRSRKLFFGLLFFLITIAPLLQIIPFGKALSSERYTYVPYIGLFYILAIFVESKLLSDKKWMKYLVLSGTVIWLIFLTIQTRKQSTAWENGETLWTQVIDQYPNSNWAYMSRGLYYAEQDETSLALEDLNQSIEIEPFAQALYERGILIEVGDPEGALRDYYHSIELDSTYAKSHVNIGVIHGRNNELDKAINSFEAAIRNDEDYSFAYFNCATALKVTGNQAKALKYYSKAISIEPKNVRYITFRGVLLLDMAKYEKAVEDFTRAIELDPNGADPYYLRSVGYFNLNNRKKALDDAQTAAQKGYPVPEEYMQ